MSTTTTSNIISPKIGEGIFLVKDVATILNLDYDKVRRWILGYWDGHLAEGLNYTFGEKKGKAINFYSLIEFYTFFKLREKGIGAAKIKALHKSLSERLNTPYPFAQAKDFYIEDREYKKFVFMEIDNGFWKYDKRDKIYLSFINDNFLEKIQFDDNNLAIKFFPIGRDKNVVVDPPRQFGQPIVLGTNIKVETLYNLHKGGESDENICTLYNLSEDKVKDALSFYLNEAA